MTLGLRTAIRVADLAAAKRFNPYSDVKTVR